MTDGSYPAEGKVRRAFEKIERNAIDNCSMAVATTPGVIQNFRLRFPQVPDSRFRLIENGYDDEDFSSIPASAATAVRGAKPFVLLHSGVIYPSERDPVEFFKAVALLLQQGRINPASLQIVLRAPHHETYLQRLIEQHAIGAIVSLAPPIPYRQALTEMLAADGLLILQASNCNSQIPAKLYEYLRAQRPILGLTDPCGDTAATLRNVGIDTIAPLNSASAIAAELLRFLDLAYRKAAPIASMDKILTCSRKARTSELAELLDQVTKT
jgi:hypothetical protein